MPRAISDTTSYLSVAAFPYEPALVFHRHLAKKLRVRADFRARPSTDLGSVLRAARQEAVGGLIIGKHLEYRALNLADHVDPAAAEASAANAFVLRPDGTTRALNTVVGAMLLALKRVRVRSTDVVAVHGAGAPASAVCAALRAHGVQDVVITGRNENTGRLLAALHGFTWLPFVPRSANVLINATPLGDMGPLSKQFSLPAEAIERATAVIDLALGPHATPVVRLARAAGARTVPGMAVVADQWIALFQAFTGVRPRPGQVDRALREAYDPVPSPRNRSIPA